jgi:hypothetical protein
MDKFIHRRNLALFSKRLADPGLTGAQRKVILTLRTEEQGKDRRTTPPTQVPASGPPSCSEDWPSRTGQLEFDLAQCRRRQSGDSAQAARVSELLWLANRHEA